MWRRAGGSDVGGQVDEAPHRSPSDLPEGPSPRPHPCSCYIDVHVTVTASTVDGMGSAATAHPATFEVLCSLAPAHSPSCPTTEHGQYQA